MPTRSLTHNAKPASSAAGRTHAFLLRLEEAADTTTTFSPESHCHLLRGDDTAATPCGPLDRVMRAEPPAVRAQTTLARHAATGGPGRALDFGEDGAPLL